MSYLAQLVIALLVAGWLIRQYWPFLPDFGRFVAKYPTQAALLAIAYLLVYGQIGTSLGLTALFWHENPIQRAEASFGVTLLLALIGINAFYLVPARNREQVVRRVDARVEATALHLPFGSWLEPRRETDHWHLSRFLRLSRTPFLLLLVAPAVLPGLVVNLPHAAPRIWGRITPERLLVIPSFWLGDHPDASVVPSRAWAIAVISWGSGILLGVLAIKAYVKLGQVMISTIRRMIASASTTARASRRGEGAAEGPEPPAAVDSPGPWPIRWRKGTFFGLFLLTYLGMCLWEVAPSRLSRNMHMQPAFAICVLLALVSVVSAMLSMLKLWARLLVLALGVAWIGVCNAPDDQYRFEYMNYDVNTLVPIRTRLEEAQARPVGADGLADDAQALVNWRAYNQPLSATPLMRPKLVVVCVTGGATRSAYWTALVLERLGQAVGRKPGGPGGGQTFDNHVRLITGASGGMVGAAHYVRYVYGRRLKGDLEGPGFYNRPYNWRANLPTNDLEAVARSLALHEPWAMLWPGPRTDRGVALERGWYDLRHPVRDLGPLEAKGMVPSIVFSPMTVEDGRRLVISNLDLAEVVQGGSPGGTRAPTNKAGRLSMRAPTVIRASLDSRALSNKGSELSMTDGGTQSVYSLSNVEFFKAFPDAQGFLLSTAARMSATFPFVSPAVCLPGTPALRVVDAGYYDNYGVDLAVAWIGKNREWLLANTSGVVLIQIRDSQSRRARLDFPDEAPQRSLLEDPFKGLVTLRWSNALSGFQFFFSPLDAALMARTTTSMFRNDQAVAALSERFRFDLDDRNSSFFTTAIFENSAKVRPLATNKENWPGLDDLANHLMSETELNPRPSVDPPDPAALKAARRPFKLDTTLFKEKYAKARASEMSDVALSWYLTEAERAAIESAIPRDENARQFLESMGGLDEDACEFLDVVRKMPAGQDLNATLTDKRAIDLYVKNVTALRAEAEDPKNAAISEYLVHLAEQAANYNRIARLAQWWRTNHNPRPEPALAPGSRAASLDRPTR